MAWIYRECHAAAQAQADESLRCSTTAYGAALPRAAENATMQGFPRRAPTLTATGESVGPGPARDTVARGPALAPAFP